MAATAVVRIEGKKLVLGGVLSEELFQYGVYEQGTDDLVATGVNEDDGSITFTDITLTEEKDYNYVIREINAASGWTLDETEYRVKVSVKKDHEDEDEFLVDIEYTDGFPIFNSTKEIDDEEADSKVVVGFPSVDFTKPGVYEYTIRETSEDGEGWTIDKTEYPVVITIVDNGMGHLVPTIEYPNGFPVFQNSYAATSISILLSALKVATGAPLTPGQFTFGVFDEEGDEVASSTN